MTAPMRIRSSALPSAPPSSSPTGSHASGRVAWREKKTSSAARASPTTTPTSSAAAFERQLALSHELDLPVVIHSREAAQDTLELVKKYRPQGVVHCFSGSAELAREYAAMGLYLGFTGVVTFPNAKKPLEAARAVPLPQLLIETDCPYLAPVPHRGQRCDSTMLPFTAAAIAAARGIDRDALVAAAWENAARVYRLGI
jgi:TatD DNase family protein